MMDGSVSGLEDESALYRDSFTKIGEVGNGFMVDSIAILIREYLSSRVKSAP